MKYSLCWWIFAVFVCEVITNPVDILDATHEILEDIAEKVGCGSGTTAIESSLGRQQQQQGICCDRRGCGPGCAFYSDETCDRCCCDSLGCGVGCAFYVDGTCDRCNCNLFGCRPSELTLSVSVRTRRDLCSTGVRVIDSMEIEDGSKNHDGHREATIFELPTTFAEAVQPLSVAVQPIHNSVNSVSFDESDISNEINNIEEGAESAFEKAEKAFIVATGITAKVAAPLVKLGAKIASPFVKLGTKAFKAKVVVAGVAKNAVIRLAVKAAKKASRVVANKALGILLPIAGKRALNRVDESPSAAETLTQEDMIMPTVIVQEHMLTHPVIVEEDVTSHLNIGVIKNRTDEIIRETVRETIRKIEDSILKAKLRKSDGPITGSPNIGTHPVIVEEEGRQASHLNIDLIRNQIDNMVNLIMNKIGDGIRAIREVENSILNAKLRKLDGLITGSPNMETMADIDKPDGSTAQLGTGLGEGCIEDTCDFAGND